MATQEEIIKKQAEQIETLKKACAMLESRIRRLEQTERTVKTNINNNARDIRNVAVQVAALQQRGR